MLLIGFTWIFVALAAGVLATYAVPGRTWDHVGPLAILVASTGAFFGSLFSYFVFTPPGRLEDPSSPAMVPGIILSLVGGFGAFAAYAFSERRKSTA
jgi:drug/metabolite transporter (DMT)-like permease